MRHLKYHSTDSGYCRVYYKLGRHLYCVQEEAKGVFEFYSCSSEGEPQWPVKIEGCVFDPIPEPDAYEREFMAWLKDKAALLEPEEVA